jgi:hypothetical protein
MPFSKEIKEKIRQTYLSPFLDSARVANISPTEAIRTILALFNRYGENLLVDGAIANIEKNDLSLKGNRLLASPSCHAALLAAAKFYFDTETQKTLVPSVSKPQSQSDVNKNSIFKSLNEQQPGVQVQTDFRDLCHEEINPILGMSEGEIRALLPEESRDNAIILYGIGGFIPLKITKFLCGSAHREEIPDKEFKDSMRGYLIAYPSLYQATESVRDKYQASRYNYLAPICAVLYAGKQEDLAYPILSLDGGGGKPPRSLQSCRVEHDAFIPLRGVLVRPDNAFGAYEVMNSADMPHVSLNQQQDNNQATSVKP